MVKLKLSGNHLKPAGQAMVEYALILVLLALAAGVTLAATGPAIGNVFCNVVGNLGGSEAAPKGGFCGSQPTDVAGLGGNPALFWQTVTWVAGHPQTETPFPTPVHRAPTSVGAGLPNTYTPTPTPTNTATATKTPTPTNTYTPSPGPSPTTSDFAFNVPYVDQINNPAYWRLDNDVISLTGSWAAQWYDASTISGCTTFCSISETSPKNPTTLPGTGVTALNLTMASGSNPSAAQAGSATGLSAGGTTYAATFTYSLTVGKTATYAFTVNVGADEAANVSLDGTRFLSVIPAGNSATANVSISAGSTHTLTVVYGQNSGAAKISLTATRLTSSPDDVVSGVNSCKWGQNSSPATAGIAGSNAVSATFQFEANPGLTTFTAGQTCYLELRGYVDLTGNAHPIFSFWDIWDFTGAIGTTAQLQVGKYVLTGGVEDRTQLNWQTVATRSTNTSNYAWTRSQYDLSNLVATLGNQVTFRFVIGATTPGAVFRWYLDDLQIVNDTTSTKTFTVNNTWDLNARTQMQDFIYDGDSFDNPGLTGAGTSRRWDLTSTNAHSVTGWDDSPAGTSNTGHTYQDLQGIGSLPTGQANARVHYLEFKYPIDLTSAPSPDANNNSGHPLLTFWEAYDIKTNAKISVQYTRDTNDPSENLSNGTLETWTDIPVQGVLVDYNSVPSGASRTNLTMQPVQIDLTNIPNWDTQKFRLRFALSVDNTSGSTLGEGWYIDDIAFQRDVASPYLAYPFVDDAESSAFTASTWDAIGGQWGRTTEKGGAQTTATSYSDSPLANYNANTIQMLQMHYSIDLLNDTPANTTDPAARAPANNPVLSFWHQRSVGAGVNFTVDMWTPYTAWTAIWTYNSSTDGFTTQKAWERVEINLASALQQVTGKTMAQLLASPATDDDDIKIRFDFQSGATVGDGVYVDEIHIQDGSAIVQHMSNGTNSGNDYYGNYTDGIEFATANSTLLGGAWYSRWYTGGQWAPTNVAGFAHGNSAPTSLSMTDSPTGNYADNTYSVMELIPIVDLTATGTGKYPTFYFWTRFAIGSDDSFRVEIATEDTSGTAAALTNKYNKVGGWSIVGTLSHDGGVTTTATPTIW